jgi:uncharacterized membrane protein
MKMTGLVFLGLGLTTLTIFYLIAPLCFAGGDFARQCGSVLSAIFTFPTASICIYFDFPPSIHMIALMLIMQSLMWSVVFYAIMLYARKCLKRRKLLSPPTNPPIQ